ncbi:YwmB family TATA-box binding protein [Clostridium sp.]|uniref:YwmB family TATA-box binding protein n=1 Tax=Clostridium sp. TaxID=1506 RepID=UPI003D6D6182
MKRKNITLLCIVLCLIILRINVRLSNAKDEFDLFDEILIQTKSKIVEYGLETTFKTQENPKEICNKLIDKLELDNSEIKLNVVENDNFYCIDFLGKNIKGYIESSKYSNEEVVTINISKIGSENDLQSLKSKVSNCIGDREENIKYFQYLKAKIPYTATKLGVKDINLLNEKIIKILKSHGTENIETVKIYNGLSTVAYTKKYDEKLNNNKLTDFNYAICNYSSGSYIIIGTPEIITTY